MGLRMLGDSAWLFEAGGNDSRSRLELVLRVVGILENKRIPELRDVVSSFDSVAVHFDPMDGGRVLSWLTRLSPPGPAAADSALPRTHVVPVVYGGECGPDLASLASATGLGEQEIIGLHSEAEYTVAALGFSPGFPYLAGLPEALRVPRRATPRTVAAGSVAIAGGQAGIYPFASQGGWHVLGRTNLRVFDPARAEPGLMKPGDRVRFMAVETLDFPRQTDCPECIVDGGLEVREAGALTSVQDLGRAGYQCLGVSPGGAADAVAARVANRLVGNPDDAALLECCMTGPVLRFREAVRVAWVGWGSVESGRPVEMAAGAELDLRGPMRSVRGYVAVSGGIDVPRVMGSRATDVRAGFGGHHGRVLRSGDRLGIGPRTDGPKPGAWRIGWPRMDGGMIELRFLKGVQAGWFGPQTREQFRNSSYRVSPESDRMGVRLDGPELPIEEARELVSQPVVAGSVQVPPDGRPIVLMAERQTIGGYPQIGHVISADLPQLARAWPGTRLRFREVTLGEAREAWGDLQRELALLEAGLDFLR